MNTSLRKFVRQVVTGTGVAAIATCAFAAVNPPPGPGQTPDYFGVVPNFAASPQPILTSVIISDSGGGTGAIAAATIYDYNQDVQTDGVTDVQVLVGGSGYSAATTVTIQGGPGVTTPATVDPIIVNGVITGFTVVDPGAGYSKAPIAGTGLRKFVDSLPMPNAANNLGQQLPIAVPDTTTFAGSDYYEIGETEYAVQMHSDLPPTSLRGYKQLNNCGVAGAACANHYLGPVILAQKNRAVRIKIVNQLSIGAAGNLPIPVDTTYMGSTGSADTQNRTSLHLHGGTTPWISDGTPRQTIKPVGEVGPNKGESTRNVPDMWFDAAGVLIDDTTSGFAPCQGQVTCAVPGATNDPGDGAQTVYWTNQQSARLMFYHDHAEGITRLNVYAGLAAGYIIGDDTEAGIVSSGLVPDLGDMIPLVIQEKTFVPDNTQPVLNFYGPFASQLNSQDPTWAWGTGNAALGLNGNGDLWVPHVYMTNQNPGDVSGANAMGRWDYGPWFWPPFVGIQNGPVLNPYYDSTCVSSLTNYCEGQYIPGAPNPSGTPEAFNDTPVVNGTAYPFIKVEPKKYRLRILSVANDRVLNLSLLVAASKNSPTTAGAVGTTLMCDGNTIDPATNALVDPADCTEVKMVPFDASQNKITPFPSWWYTFQKSGVTFDGRPSGVFDPNTRGPEMVQIGTEGGFLSSPVEIKNQPVNFEYNVKNIVIGNIKEHALLLGPAERADVIVDFSQFAGATLIMYNDSPAPVPAFDVRQDYYTGDFDNTDTGGTFTTIPGYGPNTRTVMQFRVDATCSSANCGTGSNRAPTSAHPVDDVDTAHLASLTTAVQTAFRTGQPPIIVPQSAYNATYGVNVADSMGGDLSRIADVSLTYQPLVVDASFNVTLGNAVALSLQPKSIIEDFTVDYGRMNAMLGVEVPHTTAINQTSIPQSYIDPPTELVKLSANNGTPVSGTLADGTQLWKVTHNGVDTHAIHFHLFDVQVVNRVGWDGAVSPPQDNELGWKDTVRMNPLEDIVVALRPKTIALPFKVPNSHRILDPSHLADANPAFFANLDPTTGNASNVANNVLTNFGWEYVWHCHILGHEENDMMRAIAVAQQPEIPSIPGLTTANNNLDSNVTVSWTDNSMVSNWVAIQRDTVSTFDSANLATINVPVAECDSQIGCVRSYTDTSVKVTNTYFYRVIAKNTIGGGNGVLEGGYDPTTGAYLQTLPPELASLNPGFIGYGSVTASSDAGAAQSLFVLGSPVAASNVSIQRTSTGSATITFTDASTNETSFRAQVSTDGGATWAFVGAAFNRNTTQSLATGDVLNRNVSVSNTTNALYRVLATNAIGSTPSAVVSLNNTVAPTAPMGVTVAWAIFNAANDRATLAWIDTANNNASYTVQSCVNTAANGNCTSATATWNNLTTNQAGNAVTYTTGNLARLAAGVPVSYSFRVIAVNSVGSAASTINAGPAP